MGPEGKKGKPTTWAELSERFCANPDGVAENFSYFARQLEKKGATPLDLGVPLTRCVNMVTAAAILGTEAQTQPMFDRVRPVALGLFRSRSTSMDKLVLPRLAVLSALNLAECSGWQMEVAADRHKILDKLLATPQQTEDETRWIVFALLAHGRVEALPELLLTEPFDAPPDPAAHYEFNIHGLQVHLGRAIAYGAGLDSVRAAWADYLGLFPRLYGANVTTYAELLLCARAVHAVIGSASVAGTLAWLRSEIG